MTQIGLNVDPRLGRVCGVGAQHADVSGPMEANVRPCLVLLESGIQAIIKVASFTYVEGLPVAIGHGFAKDVDATDWLEAGPDGVRLKSVSAPTGAIPFDI